MAKTSSMNHRPEVKAFLDDLLPTAFPGVTIGWAFGYPAYKIDGRIFAFVGGEGIVLKLGAAAVDRLHAPGTSYTRMVIETGAVWKDWLSIDHADPVQYEDDVQLFADSIDYVRLTR